MSEELPLVVGGGESGITSTPALDVWRANYKAGTCSMADHKRLYERIAAEYPDQNYYAWRFVKGFLDWAKPKTVVELGGWDGALARTCLPQSGVHRWLNYEVADVPQVCTDSAYRFLTPDHFVWEYPIMADAFVASHVLEHLTERDLLSLIEALVLGPVKYAYVDVPLITERTTWMGTTTTHALEMSISEFDQAWHDAGYRIARKERRNGEVPSFVRYLQR